ncbi:hypothetical protein LH128_25915 [Sphingomonas sp. LH128]|nr:hypothetical protein LH128_25915 [Sphingomonas sp. LH128]
MPFLGSGGFFVSAVQLLLSREGTVRNNPLVFAIRGAIDCAKTGGVFPTISRWRAQGASSAHSAKRGIWLRALHELTWGGEGARHCATVERAVSGLCSFPEVFAPIFVIASTAKQSRAVYAALDCFAVLAMTRGE